MICSQSLSRGIKPCFQISMVCYQTGNEHQEISKESA
jgi:hypothetical protein